MDSPIDPTNYPAVLLESLRSLATQPEERHYRVVFDYFYPKLVIFFRVRNIPSHRIEDCAQDVLLLVWRKAAAFDPTRGSVAVWVFTIARSIAIDTFRRERHDRYELLDNQALRSSEPNPEEQACNAEAAAMLRAMMQDLSFQDFELLSKAYFEDFSHSQLAQCQNRPLGTIKSRLRRISIALRAQLEGIR